MDTHSLHSWRSASVVAVFMAIPGAVAQPPSRPPTVSGRLFTSAGIPLSRQAFVLAAICPGGPNPSRRRSHIRATTDADGAFSADLSGPGKHEVLIAASGVGWARVKVPATEGELIKLGDIILQPSIPVAGIVRQKGSGDPVAHARVRAYAARHEPHLYQWGRVAAETSDAEGRFALSVSEGEFTVSIVEREWVQDHEVQFQCRRGEPVEGPVLEVRRAPVMSGRILDENDVEVREKCAVELSVVPSSGFVLPPLSGHGVCEDGRFSVNLRGFGSGRVWAFVPGTGHGLTEEAYAFEEGAQIQTDVTVGTTPLVNTFESGLGALRLFAVPAGADLALEETTAAEGERSLKVTLPADSFAGSLSLVPGHLLLQPGWVLEFDYRVPAGEHIDLFVTAFGRMPWGQIGFTVPPDHARWPLRGRIEGVVADNEWHHARFDLYECLTATDELRREFRHCGGGCRLSIGGVGPTKGAGAPGTEGFVTFWLDNVRIGPPEG